MLRKIHGGVATFDIATTIPSDSDFWVSLCSGWMYLYHAIRWIWPFGQQGILIMFNPHNHKVLVVASAALVASIGVLTFLFRNKELSAGPLFYLILRKRPSTLVPFLILTRGSMEYNTDSEPYQSFEKLCVLAPGLLGASVAMASRQNRAAKYISIWSRRASSRAKLVGQPWCDEVCETPESAAKDADLVVICSPVDFVVPLYNDIKPILKRGAIITDVGSTKSLICRQTNAAAESSIHFVGSHPMAGSEKTGMVYGDTELFVNRPCIVTPTEDVADQAVRRVIQFWKSLGAVTFVETPEAHDEIVAHISHLPHLIATALCNFVGNKHDNWEQLAGNGFKDTTRVASGDPSLWKSIIETNRDEINRALSNYQDELHRVQSALTNNNMVQIVSLLEQGKQFRDRLS